MEVSLNTQAIAWTGSRLGSRSVETKIFSVVTLAREISETGSADLELQMQPQEEPVSDISLAKVTTVKIFVSTDLDPNIDPVQAIA